MQNICTYHIHMYVIALPNKLSLYGNGYIMGGFPLAIAIPAIPASIMLRSAGKRRALSVLEKHEICRKRLEPEHATEKLSDFGKNLIDNEVGNYIDPSLT